MSARLRFAALLPLLVVAAGCDAEACEENAGAQVLEVSVELQLPTASITAELADEPHERERGWMRRACGREAIVLVPEQPMPLPVWGCELTGALDVYGISNAEVVAAERLEPCEAPCGGCPLALEGVEVDAVLELPVDAVELGLGDSVLGL